MMFNIDHNFAQGMLNKCHTYQLHYLLGNRIVLDYLIDREAYIHSMILNSKDIMHIDYLSKESKNFDRVLVQPDKHIVFHLLLTQKAKYIDYKYTKLTMSIICIYKSYMLHMNYFTKLYQEGKLAYIGLICW